MSAPKKTGGRRPVDQSPDGPQAMWQALKKTPEHITATAVATATKLHRSTVGKYLKALTASGHLAYDEPPVGTAGSWRLINDIGFHAPRVRADGSKVTQGEITKQIWQAMQGLKKFDYRELMQNSTIDIPEETAKDYCKRLLAAGYLRVLSKANPAEAKIARYLLIRSSGPQAPQIQRVRQVYDPNTGAIYALENGQ